MSEAAKIRLSMHCTCGEYLVGEVNSAPLADDVMRLFARRHLGKGHRPYYPALEPKRQRPPRGGQD